MSDTQNIITSTVIMITLTVIMIGTSCFFITKAYNTGCKHTNEKWVSEMVERGYGQYTVNGGFRFNKRRLK